MTLSLLLWLFLLADRTAGIVMSVCLSIFCDEVYYGWTCE